MVRSLIGLPLVAIGVIIWIVGFFMNLDILNPEDTSLCLAIIVIGGLICALGGIVLIKGGED